MIETLKTVDKDRKCFRMVGGILSERTVNDVLPKLESNRIQVRDIFVPFCYLKLIKVANVIFAEVSKKGLYF